MEEKIRYATQYDISPMKKLWAECFPKDVEYAKFFFENIFKLPCARVCEVEGKCVAMIHVFPRLIESPFGEMTAKYIYGVGTTKDFRGRGIAGRMLEAEAKDCDLLVLIPQGESLFEFYKKYGFSEICEVSKSEVLQKEKAPLKKANEGDIPYINAIYEKCLADYLYAKRDEKTWKLLMDEYEFLGGGFMVFDGGYCAYYKEGDNVFITEFFSEKRENVLGEISDRMSLTTKGSGTKLAVIRPVSDAARTILGEQRMRYINLMHN